MSKNTDFIPMGKFENVTVGRFESPSEHSEKSSDFIPIGKVKSSSTSEEYTIYADMRPVKESRFYLVSLLIALFIAFLLAVFG